MILCSVDGICADIYSKYRKGGNFELIMKNVKAIQAQKRKYHKSTPHLQWKFTVFDYNVNEIPYVRKMYKDFGFDSYTFQYDMYNNKRFHSKAIFHPLSRFLLQMAFVFGYGLVLLLILRGL